MKIFNSDYLNRLSSLASGSIRKRQNYNIHQSYQDACQRLFNAIEPGSYIHPHRHASDPRDEMLVAIRGLMALVAFDEHGKITETIYLGTEKYGLNVFPVVEIPSNTWHTVVALKSGSVLLEIKSGPFDPEQPKELASWAPMENTPDAANYLLKLLSHVNAPEFK